MLHALGAEAYAQALAEHRRVVRLAVTARGGVEVDTQGDAFFVAFADASAAVEAARLAQETFRAGPMRVRMGLHTGTPHFDGEGYVGEAVHLGARISAAGHGGQVLLSGETRARAHLEALVARVGETAGISVADGARNVLYLDQVEADQDVTLRDWTGERVPFHAVSSGLVLLAARTNAEVREYCADGLARFTDHTVTRATELKRRLTQIRADGYAWTVEEFVDGVSSVAAPICDDSGAVVAALHVHGPSYRLRPSNCRVTQALLATASRL